MVQEKYLREKYQAVTALAFELRQLGVIKLRGVLTPEERKTWRVPGIGTPFQINLKNGDVREFAVPGYVADILEADSGVRWTWTIPTEIPFIGGKDAYRGFTQATNTLKTYKFVLAFGQAIDLTSRRVFGTHFQTGLRLDKSVSGLGEMFFTYFKGSESRRLKVLDKAQSMDPVLPNRPGITHKNYILNGLAGADKSWFANLANDTLPDMFNRAASNMPSRLAR